ncbi:MAG: hypothetical protein ACRD0Q_05290 [Acidimicrobiales bacterium]
MGLVADAANTVVVINAGGRTYRHSAYALEFASGDTPARRALSAFVDATQDLPPGESPWEPEAIAVYLLGAYRAEPELPQPEMRWPLSTLLRRDGDPAVDPSCTLVAGADATTLRQALNRATARTPWAVDGKLVSLAFRPLLPGQPGCEPAEK